MSRTSIERILSLPPAMARYCRDTGEGAPAGWHLDADPPGIPLGSGGGTCHMLERAWRARDGDMSFAQWLADSRKLVVHGGGMSRRLLAYSAVGKPLIPMPLLERETGQKPGQTLLDIQSPAYLRMLETAPEHYRVMVASGDVIVRYGGVVPAAPEADICIIGMRVGAETATGFGVLFTGRDRPSRLAFFLQKPSVRRIREAAGRYTFLVDTGMWLFSEKALMTLMARSGWDDARECFSGGMPGHHDMYATFGPALGDRPDVPDDSMRGLSCAVLELPDPGFHHLGTCRQLIGSVAALAREGDDGPVYGPRSGPPRERIVFNAGAASPALPDDADCVWIESSAIPPSWTLKGDTVLTGIPPNDWDLTVPRGVCLDIAPVSDDAYCIRPYGIDDAFRGRYGDDATTWFNAPVRRWFEARGIAPEDAGIGPDDDIHEMPLFPVRGRDGLDGVFISWMLAPLPDKGDGHRRRWLDAERLSARALAERVNIGRILSSRRMDAAGALRSLMKEDPVTAFSRIDLHEAAGLVNAADIGLPEPGAALANHPLASVKRHMFLAALGEVRGGEDAGTEEMLAFQGMREAVERATIVMKSRPVCGVQRDQIVWARSPVRLDLAGGWSDTPPYCLEYGGSVVNFAADLNGQPPIQVFARLSDTPAIVVRSIDLGLQESITSYAQIEDYARPGSGFVIARAALALAGFLPRFNGFGGQTTLEDQLAEFGGGIELTMLAAVPQGSGLGTSSILAATILGALDRLCGLGWGTAGIIERTLVLEQMLTTGGGWQDQVGGILRGIKHITSVPGLRQSPEVAWLPEHLLAGECVRGTVLLYYTGITRMARGILQDIVRGMFLNRGDVLRAIGDIADNARHAADSIRRGDREALVDAVRWSWSLNRRLDSGTDPEPVRRVIAPVMDHLDAVKLLGAGGGGYMLMFAKDASAAARVRRILEEEPPNGLARFVGMSLSGTGLEVTTS